MPLKKYIFNFATMKFEGGVFMFSWAKQKQN